MVGRKFKVIVGNVWSKEFVDSTLEICEGYDPEHHQYPAMTKYGRTWFDKDKVQLL